MEFVWVGERQGGPETYRFFFLEFLGGGLGRESVGADVELHRLRDEMIHVVRHTHLIHVSVIAAIGLLQLNNGIRSFY